MENIKNLLNQVTLIGNKNAEILDATGSRFNMFKVCGVDHYENTHSAILAEFLRPDGPLGLKSKFLECFLQLNCKDESFRQIFNCENAYVITEYSTNAGRMDIVIRDKED